MSRTTDSAILKDHWIPSRRRMATICSVLLLVALAGTAPAADKSAAAIENSQLFIPASAHVSGALDTNWRTDLEIYNPGQSQASVTVALLKAGTSNQNPQTRTYTLDPGESRRFADALMSMFGYDGGAAIRVVNNTGMAALTSRTYNLTDDGTYGQFVGGVISQNAIQPGQEGRIVQLTHNRSTTSGFRTNIGFVNATASQITVDVDMYRANGSFLGTKSWALDPYEFRQIDKIFQKVVSGDVDDGYAVLSSPTPGGAFFAYGVVIDNVSSDPIYITPATRPRSGSAPSPTATPTPTTTTTPTPTPTATPTPTGTPNANLAPYQPDGWSGALVASGTTGTRTTGGLSASGATYFDGAIANYGPDDAVFGPSEYLMRLSLDGSAVVSFYGSPTESFTLTAGHYVGFDDYQVDGISSGAHNATIIADPSGVIPENNESDNSWNLAETWSAKSGVEQIKAKVPKASLHVAPIPGWSSDSTKASFYPAGIVWHGGPPLKQGTVSGVRTKATTIDNNLYIPASAHASGALNTNWRTDVQLHNPGSVQARVQIDMLKRDQENSTPQTRTFLIAARASTRLQDILYSSFSFDGAAALRITVLEGDVIATSRTYNLTTTGTYGQYGGTVHGAHAFSTGERALLMQLTHNASTAVGFRTNVGLVNCTNQTITVDLDLRSASGTSYGTLSYSLRPYEFIQKDKIFKRVTSNTVSDGYIHITSPTSGARYLAYATVIDNVTGDSVFIPAASVLEAEPTPASFIPFAETAFSVMGLLGQGNIPSIETMVGTIQTFGMDGIINAAVAMLPPGTVTMIPNGARVDLGSHFVARTGDVISGSVTGTYANLVNTPGALSYDYEGTIDNVMWNGQYAEIGGATGSVDFAIDSQGHVAGDVTMASFAASPTKDGKSLADVTVTGSAEFDTEICPNYPVSGSVTVTKDGDSQTISFTNSCDGTFEGGSQGQTGDVSFRLTWSGPQDLDLYVTEPSGETIYYGNTESDTHGQLDVDSNYPCSNTSQSPTENIFWPEGEAPHGTYTFWADFYRTCDGSSTASFTLRVFEGETVVRTINGTVSEDGETEHYTHVY